MFLKSWAATIMYLTAAALTMPSARAGAIFFGSVTIDVGSNLDDVAGLSVFGLGITQGDHDWVGNATAFHTNSLDHGSIDGGTNAPFGFATAFATGTDSIVLTNETSGPITFDLTFSWSYNVATFVDGPDDRTTASVLIEGSDSEGFRIFFTPHGTIHLSGNDHKEAYFDNFVWAKAMTLQPGDANAYEVTLHYDLRGNALSIGSVSPTPEPTTALLVVLGGGSLILGVRWRRRTAP